MAEDTISFFKSDSQFFSLFFILKESFLFPANNEEEPDQQNQDVQDVGQSSLTRAQRRACA